MFYPGGGGQPPDAGIIVSDRTHLQVLDVRSERGGIWHRVDHHGRTGSTVEGHIDWERRHAMMRHHALLHIVNTVALHRYGGLVTGALIGTDTSRVDVSMQGFGRTLIPSLEDEVNAVIDRDLPIRATTIPETDLRQRPDLIRTMNAQPPVEEGRIRVVEIEGFDAQACGGTHVHTTAEIGRASLVDYVNKGRSNKRLYWRLEPQARSDQV